MSYALKVIFHGDAQKATAIAYAIREKLAKQDPERCRLAARSLTAVTEKLGERAACSRGFGWRAQELPGQSCYSREALQSKTPAMPAGRAIFRSATVEVGDVQ